MKLQFNQNNFNIVKEKISYKKAIDIAGNLLLKNKFIKKEYIKTMHKRNSEVSVAIGNGLAIPHGNTNSNLILNTGFSITLFPESIDWEEKQVYVSIGLAASGDAHNEFLEVIATIFSDQDFAKQLANSNNVDDLNKMIIKKYQELK